MAFFGTRKDPVLPPSQSVLEPRLKPGQKDVHSYKPGAFETPIGRLLVPRMKDPPLPTSEMIAAAVSGELTSYFREGRIFRASRLVGQVSAQTAKISLDDMYEYQTRQLLAPRTESTKSLRTLFYVALRLDELPSYHFWIAPDAPDPVTAGEPVDWDAEFRKSRPTEWKNMQHGELEGEDSQTDDDLFSESNIPISTQTLEVESTALKGQVNKPESNILPSLPSSVAILNSKSNVSAEEGSMIEKTSTQPGGMAYARSLHIPGLRQDLAPVATIPPRGSAPQMGAKENDEGISTSIHHISGQAGQSYARIPSTKQDSSKSDATSGKGLSFAVAGRLSKEQYRETSILLRFEWGALRLEEFSHTAFRELALYLTQHEKDEMNTGLNPLFVDILKPGGPPPVEYRVPDSGSKGSREFARQIKPYLGLPGHRYRIRSNAYTSRLPFDSGQAGTLKLTRVGFGYCYIDAVGSWDSKKSSERMENSVNFQNGLSFLFGRDKSGTPVPEKEIPKLLTLQILPQPGAIDISDWLVSRELGETFHNITSSQLMTSNPLEPIPWKHSAEVFVHETGATFEHPDTLAAAAQELCDEQEREAQAARLLEQQLAHNHDETAITSQQTSQAKLSIASPTTASTIVKDSVTPSVNPAVRLQSQVEGLRRLMNSTEAMLSKSNESIELDRMLIGQGLLRSQIQGLEAQILFLTGENDRLERTVRGLDDRVDELEQESGQLKSQVEQLEDQAKGLHGERDQFERRINALQEEAIQSTKDGELLHLTVNNLEGQVLRATQERDQLQTEVSDFERQTAESIRERIQLRIQVDNLKRHPSAGSDPIHNTTQENDSHRPSQAAVTAAVKPPSGGPGLKVLLYCLVCLSSVDKLSPNVGSTTLMLNSRLNSIIGKD